MAELEVALAAAQAAAQAAGGGQASSARLRALMDSSPAGIAIWDADDRLIAFNPLYATIFFEGAEDQVRLGATFEEQSARFIALGRPIAIAGKSDTLLEERRRRRRALGEAFHQQIGDRLILSRESRTPDGGVIAVHIDMTSLKRAETALHRSDERLRAIYESAGLGIVIANADGEPVDFNVTFSDMLGYAPDELRGKRYTDYIHAADAPANRAALAEMQAGQRQRYSLESRFVRKDGQVIWGRINASRLSGAAPDEGFCVIVVEDISATMAALEALRESEARFRVMADTMPALLWMDDAEGRCIFVNKTWLDYTGRAMEEQLGLGWTKAVHPDDIAGMVTIEAEARRSHKPFTEVYRLRRGDGEYRWFLDTGAPRFGGDGAFLGFIGTLVDITDRRHLEAELHQAQKMEAIGQLTGGVAHDFNNLLTVISGNIELALDRIDGNPQVDAMLRLAMEAAEKGAALTQRLLAFARRQTLTPYAVDLGALVADLGELLRRTLGGGIEIVSSVPAGLWPALVDRNQLENAVLNLAINARDAMRDGGRLTIEAANREVAAGEIADLPPGRYVAIAVTDVGHGMSPEVQAKAIQPFFTTKETGKGSGLGLSMVYGFMKQSGGQLQIESLVGRGTTIRLLLPVAARYLRSRPASSDEDAALRLQGGSVLVVDDDPDVLNVAVSMLEGLGYRVATAVDGASALRWINEGGPFDLLLSDIVLPGGMNGVQLASAALQLRPELKVLLMSGYTEHALDEKSFPALLLHKPFRRKDLADKLQQTFVQ